MGRKKITGTTADTRTGTGPQERKSAGGKRNGKIPVKVREVRFEQEPEPLGGKERNTELGIVTYTFVFLFLLMIGYVVYLNAVKADDLNSNVYNTKQDANTAGRFCPRTAACWRRRGWGRMAQRPACTRTRVCLRM